jgi:acetylglutamate kinase
MGPSVLKLSGGLSGQPDALDAVAAHIRDADHSVILVHGGGKQINALSGRLAVPVRQVAGRRITDAATLEVLLHTVGGIVNRGLVSDLMSRGIDAIGLAGADGGLLIGRKRAPLSIDGETIDFGLVADIEFVRTDLLETLMGAGLTPVIACLAWSPVDGYLNINADTVAITVAAALNARSLTFLMEPEAVLDTDRSPVPHLTPRMFRSGVAAGWITDGMRPKLETAFLACDKGIPEVRLTNPAGLASGGGTRITGGKA